MLGTLCVIFYEILSRQIQDGVVWEATKFLGKKRNPNLKYIKRRNYESSYETNSVNEELIESKTLPRPVQ